jgi:DNA-binding PadR family transcriptional regulator
MDIQRRSHAVAKVPCTGIIQLEISLKKGCHYFVPRSSVERMRKRSPSRTGSLGRNNEPVVLILTSLASGSKHGYALSKDIEDFADVVLGPGTLYGAIARLEERGLIEPTPSDDRRQPYRITPSGREALAGAVREMRVLADEGARRLGLDELARGRTHRPTILGSPS